VGKVFKYGVNPCTRGRVVVANVFTAAWVGIAITGNASLYMGSREAVWYPPEWGVTMDNTTVPNCQIKSRPGPSLFGSQWPS
jgi:hypothetical protein